MSARTKKRKLAPPTNSPATPRPTLPVEKIPEFLTLEDVASIFHPCRYAMKFKKRCNLVGTVVRWALAQNDFESLRTVHENATAISRQMCAIYEQHYEVAAVKSDLRKKFKEMVLRGIPQDAPILAALFVKIFQLRYPNSSKNEVEAALGKDISALYHLLVRSKPMWKLPLQLPAELAAGQHKLLLCPTGNQNTNVHTYFLIRNMGSV